MRNERSGHVAIVGAGVFGAAIAFRLSQMSVPVTLVDPDEPGGHASGNNAGHLNPLHLTPDPLVPFALASFRLHAGLREALVALGQRDGGWEPIRRVVLAFDGHDTAAFDPVLRRFADHPGFAARRLAAEDVRRLEPRVSPRVVGGLLLEGSLSVDARALTRALVRAAAGLGARWEPASATGIVAAGRRITAVRTSAGDVPCDHAVFATGPWVEGPSRWLGIRLTIRPVQGQLLRVRLPGGIACDLVHGGDAVYRRGPDEAWVGGTEAEAGLDETPTTEARQRLLRGADRLLPGLGSAEVLEQTCALRPMTADRLPVILRPSHWDNVVVANGGGSKGVLLSAGVAEVVAAAVCRPNTASDPISRVA